MRFLVKRTARAVLTLWVGLSIGFFIIRFMPGNPLSQRRRMIAENNPGLPSERVQARLDSYAERIGIDLDASLPEQYINYWTDLLTGDMGVAVSQQGESVGKIIGAALPWTLMVVLISVILTFAIAIVWGAVIAYKEGGWFDAISSSASILMSSIPYYVLGLLFIIVLGYQLELFPTKFTTGANVKLSDGLTFYLDALYHAALPIAALVISQTGTWVLSMRGNSISVLGEDFVRVARLRGLSDRRISTRYVARNAILPLYTGFLMMIGYLLGSTIILEEIFRYKGIGWYMLQGIEQNDYALIMGTFIVYASALVIGVWIADLTYSYIDPRVKSGETSEAY